MKLRHGEDEPKGYIQWHYFSEQMAKKGHKQQVCKCCGLWFWQWPSFKNESK